MAALRYNTGKLKWHLIDFESLKPMVEVMMYGAHKYSTFVDESLDLTKKIKGSEVTPEEVVEKKLTLVESGEDNWKKGMDKKLILDCAMRHLIALMNGEEFDPESGKSHAGHVMCNMMFYEFNNRTEFERFVEKLGTLKS